jgi:hypothetical protein
MRKIKIDNKVYLFDRSDGKGVYPFGMNGGGGMSIYINHNKVSNNGHVEGSNKMLDGKVNFKKSNEVINFNFTYFLNLNDKNYNKLKEIHSLTWEDIEKIDLQKRLNTVLWGLKYESIEYICSGYRFGRELTYNDFCICFDNEQINIFKSSHNGYIAPDYLTLNIKTNEVSFKKLFNVIKKSIREYFNI